jgi:hypothetical protein
MREALINDVDKIAPVLRACGAKSEELGALSSDAVTALGTLGMFNLKHCTEIGDLEADPVIETMVLEQLAYHDLTSASCTMVGVTAIASLGTFLPQSGLEKVFTDRNVPMAAISFFRAGRAPACPRPFVARPQHRWPSPGEERHGVRKSREIPLGCGGRSVVMTAIRIRAESAAHQL